MKIDHRSLLSGESTGPLAVVTRAGLHGASLLYGLGSRFRRYQYDHERKPIHRVDVPVISVGNLTTGGTGKTPIVCDLCTRLRAMDRRVAIISRGYGAGESGINDEAMELAERLPDVPHVQHPDRVEAARIAVEELEAEVLVMDDGFQHRRLHRDLDIVVLDATCPFGFGYQLPRGYLREPISSLRRANLVFVTRTDQVDACDVRQIEIEVRRHNQHVPIILTSHRPSSIGLENGATESIESIRNRDVALFSAIGNPNAFERTAENCGVTVVGHFVLPDHDAYDRETRDRLRNWVLESKSHQPLDWILCTHKDFVKIAADSIADVKLGYLRIAMAIGNADDEKQVQALLSTVVTQRKASR